MNSVPLDLPLEGLWSEHPIPDGVRLEEFGGDTRIWLRGWVCAGADRRVVGDRVLAELLGTGVDWRVRVEGAAGPWPTRVVGGIAPDQTRVAHAVVELPWALVSMGCHESSERDLDEVVSRCLSRVATLDDSRGATRLDRAEALADRRVDPRSLIPWVLFDAVAATRCHGVVTVGPGGLAVAPAELRGASVRLLGPAHDFWTEHTPAQAMVHAVLNLGQQLAASRIALERWALPNRASYLVFGPHPCAPGVVLLPDLRALVQAELGDVEPALLFAGLDRVLAVPNEWPEDWKLSALGAMDRRAADVVVTGPLWRMSPPGDSP